MDESTLDKILELQNQIDGLEKRVDALESELLRSATAGLKKDELFDKITAYMKARPNDRLTALVIGANIGEDNTVVGSRLSTLASRGVIKSGKENGRTKLYWYEAK